jgi:hypothetical protein
MRGLVSREKVATDGVSEQSDCNSTPANFDAINNDAEKYGWPDYATIWAAACGRKATRAEKLRRG